MQFLAGLALGVGASSIVWTLVLLGLMNEARDAIEAKEHVE